MNMSTRRKRAALRNRRRANRNRAWVRRWTGAMDQALAARLDVPRWKIRLVVEQGRNAVALRDGVTNVLAVIEGLDQAGPWRTDGASG